MCMFGGRAATDVMAGIQDPTKREAGMTALPTYKT
jgi:hypothetical protein